jgi:hypothetical protein
MANSLNVRFSGDAVPDAEFDRPQGIAIAGLMRACLADRGWEASEIEDWRDGGWTFSCAQGQSRLDVILVKTALEREWFVCIVPTRSHLLLGWLFGLKASASPEAVLALSVDVQSILAKRGRFSEFKWCWDGFPEDDTATPEPVASP